MSASPVVMHYGKTGMVWPALLVACPTPPTVVTQQLRKGQID